MGVVAERNPQRLESQSSLDAWMPLRDAKQPLSARSEKSLLGQANTLVLRVRSVAMNGISSTHQNRDIRYLSLVHSLVALDLGDDVVWFGDNLLDSVDACMVVLSRRFDLAVVAGEKEGR